MIRLSLTILLAICSFSFSYSQSNQVPDSIEYAALKALYDSTNGDGWTNKTNWLSGTTSADFATWHGVTVTNGDVTNITIYGNNLTGTIPTAIENLSELAYLRLYQNNITGDLPELNGMSKLVQIDLTNNSISGSIPASWGNLLNLAVLKLRRNDLGGAIPSSLQNLTALTEIRLSENSLSGDIPSWFGSLPLLKYLYLNNNNLTGNLPDTWESDSIQYLYLGRNSYDPGPLPAWLADKNLIVLSLDYSNVTGTIPEGLFNITSIKIIDLSFNNLSGEIPGTIGNCTSLETLTLSHNSLTGEIPSSITQLPNLKGLSIPNNNLSGNLPEDIGTLPLETLVLQQNNISGSIPESLGNSTIKQIRLFGNNLTGAIPETLGNCTALNELYISGNQLSGAIPESLVNLPNMTKAFLSENNFTSVPDFTAYGNPGALDLRLHNNMLPWHEVYKLYEDDCSHIFSNLNTDNQTPELAPPSVEYFQNTDSLVLVGGPDDPAVQYQWQYDSAGVWVDLPGKTNYQLVISEAPASGMASYRASITTSKLCLSTFNSRTYEVRSGKGAPNASALEDFFPVNVNTGTLNMVIPIGGVSSRSLSHSMSLVYNGGGVKVHQPSGFYGTNWSLNGGGSIVRELRGIPDDLQELPVEGATQDTTRVGWLYNSYAQTAQQFAESYTEANKLDFFNSRNMIKDTEPDLFHINLPGYSGYMVFDESGNPQLYPLANLVINPTRENGDGEILYFEIIDDSGITYRFDHTTSVTEIADSIQNVYNYGTGSHYYTHTLKSWVAPTLEHELTYTTGWYMTKITHPSGDELSLEYKNTSSTKKDFSAIGQYFYDTYKYSGSQTYYKYLYENQYAISRNESYAYLTKISSLNQETELEYLFVQDAIAEERYIDSDGQVYYQLPEDEAVVNFSRLYRPNLAVRLKNVYHFYKKPSGRLLTAAYNLGYADVGKTDGKDPESQFRWFLNRITLRKGNLKVGDYTFGYQNYVGVPSARTSVTDWWGYPGGYASNGTLVPKTYVYRHPDGRFEATHFPHDDNTALLLSTGTDRQADGQSTNGTLTSVSFPTGATAAFTYEAHTFKRGDRQAEYTGGGARIRSMRFHDGVSQANDILKYFEYTDETAQTTGKMMWEPKYGYFVPDPLLRLNSYIPEYLPEAQTQEWLNEANWEKLAASSLQISPYDVNGSDHAGPVARYEKVTVKKPGEGSIVYEFDIPAYVGKYDATGFQRTKNSHLLTDTNQDTTFLYGIDEYRRFPYVSNLNMDPYLGLLKKEIIYNEDGDMMADTRYTYTTIFEDADTMVHGVYYDEVDMNSGSLYMYGKYPIRVGMSVVTEEVTQRTYNAGDTQSYLSSVVTSRFRDSQYPYLREVESTDENGITSIQRNYYADEIIYGKSGTEPGLLALQERVSANRVGTPVEQVAIKVVSSTEKVLGASLSEYAIVNDGSSTLVNFSKSYALPAGEGLTDFVPLADASAYTIDSRYIQGTEVLSYQSYGISKELTDRSKATTATIMGYDYTLPLAEITFAPVSTLLYNDFPYDSENGFTFSPASQQEYLTFDGEALSITGTASREGFDEFILSGVFDNPASVQLQVAVSDGNGQNINTTWTIPAGSQWAYHELPLDVSAFGTELNITITRAAAACTDCKLDQLALFPAEAIVTTYAYELPNGLIRTTDSNGNFMAIEYDDAFKPVVKRDHEGNIREVMEYQKSRAKEEFEAWMERLDTLTDTQYHFKVMVAELDLADVLWYSEGIAQPVSSSDIELAEVNWYYQTEVSDTWQAFDPADITLSTDQREIHITKDCKNYTVIAEVIDQFGNTRVLEHKLDEQPTFSITEMTGNNYPEEGASETYKVITEGSFCGSPSYEWFTVDYATGDTTLIQQTTQEITITTDPSDHYLYCIVRDDHAVRTIRLLIDPGVQMLVAAVDTQTDDLEISYHSNTKKIYVTHTGGTAPYTYEWYYKLPADTEYELKAITTDVPSFTYSHPHSQCAGFDFKVMVYDGIGYVDTVTGSATLASANPTANLSMETADPNDTSPYTNGAGIDFEANAFGTRGALTYKWEITKGSNTTTLPNTTRTISLYETESYSIKLTITDECGATDSTSMYIEIDPNAN